MDSEDCESWLVEEGIGHFNRYGNFEYGEAPFGWSDDGSPEDPDEIPPDEWPTMGL
jgi:hypothetical protein